MTIVGIKHRAVEILESYHFLSKRNNVHFLHRWNKTLRPDRALLNVSSSNNIIEVWINREKYYLRLIDEHVNSTKLLKNIIFKYEQLLNISLPVNLKEQIEKNASTFKRMGYIDDFSSSVYHFFKYDDPSILSIHLDNKSFSLDHLKAFIHFTWSELASYRKNTGCSGWQTYNYNRCKCQEALYELFNIDRLICKSSLVKVRIDNYNCYGFLMKEAKGENPLAIDMKEIRESSSNILKSELNILNIMDVICYERDHRPGNYNIVFDEDNKTIVSIEAFDNDSDFSFFPTISVKKSFVGSVPIINNKGYINRPFLDGKFVNALLSVKDRSIIEVVKPYLNRIQQICLLIRLHKIQRAIKKTHEMSSDGLESIEMNHNNQRIRDYYDVLMNWNEFDKDSVLQCQGRFNKIELNHRKIEIMMDIE